jgi:peptide/nickel transport system permease protein
MRDAADSTAPSNAAPRSGTVASARRSRLAAFLDSDLLHSFLRSRLVVLAALVSVLIVGAAVLAPLIAPHDPYDLKSLSLLDANTPPAWE